MTSPPSSADQENPVPVHPALLQEQVDVPAGAPDGAPGGGRVRCLTCERRCLLRPGELGWCRTRRNDDGTLATLIYGAVSSLSANPIEKKPLCHFHPGTVAMTAGSWSCNFDCPWCQNWGLSKRSPLEQEEGRPMLRRYSPAAFVELTVGAGCQGTSISFNEPTLSLEWALEVFRLARSRGLYNTFVTNGYMTGPALDLLAEAGLDAANIDLKGDAAVVKRYCEADVDVVWRNARRMRELGIWVELTTLVIPTVNDEEAMLRGIARRIAAELGPGVPWHVNAYYPAYRFHAPPTPLGTLERAWQIGREEGLDYVYVGNVPNHPKQHTTCPNCGTGLVERAGLGVRANRLEEGRCPRCGRAIPGVW